MDGVAEFKTMSRFPSVRVWRTASTRFWSPRRRATPRSSATVDTNVTAVLRGVAAANIGRYRTGSGVGIDAFGSPMAAYAIIPDFRTSSGLTPKNADFHSTRSASLPASIEPIR
jgi:hypothetical protein